MSTPMRHRRTLAVTVARLLVAAALLTAVDPHVASAQRGLPRRGGAGAGGGAIGLPYNVNDSAGGQWMVYPGGWVQQQGNQPTFGQAAMLTIGNNQPQSNNNTARMDAETGEIVFENLSCGPFTVTRRVLIDGEQRLARYVDVIKNPQNQEQTAEVRLTSNVNYGVQSGEVVPDPRKKGQDLAWVVQTGGGGAVAELFAGAGSKVPVQVQWQQGNNQSTASMRLTVPPRGEVAIVHLHANVPTQAAGVEWVQSIKESKLFASVPRQLRRLVVNFRVGLQFIGGRELLRGDASSDVIELRGGDQLRGNVKDANFALKTFYGDVSVPADRVVGLLNVGEFRPRQLVVTADGQILGGQLDRDAVAIELSTGQVTNVPVAQISRLGYRKRPNEPEEWTLDKPMVLLRSGERVAIKMPAGPIEVMTRYGLLKLPPASVRQLVFQDEERELPVHEVQLTDGSRLAGLVTNPELTLELADEAGKPVKMTTGAVARLHLAAGNEDDAGEPADGAPTLTLSGGDVLVGTLEGTLKLDATFDTLSVNAAEVRTLVRGGATEAGGPSSRGGGGTTASDAGELPGDVQVTLWDSSVLRGRVQEDAVGCKLRSGVTLSVPVALIERYDQPEPQPSAAMGDRIKGVVGNLDADDWRTRDAAEAELIGMGNAIVPVLRELRSGQPPEAQQRIDQILTKLGAKPGAGARSRDDAQPKVEGQREPAQIEIEAVQMPQ